MFTIRNFCIIAHIDHGKSTLADRFLELTGAVEKRKMREQYLDQMELEREKGITIKMQPVRMKYKLQIPNAESGNLEFRIQNSGLSNSEYILNLIDTPGHVDFSYEVSRALAAVEGAILLVDATQGIQAQTISNLHLAQKENLTIVPVINKIDLPGARIEETREEISKLTGIEGKDIFCVSAKENIGIEETLVGVIRKIPPPEDGSGRPFRALIFDSQFDSYKGIIAHVRIVDGEVRKNSKIRMLASGAEAEVLELGFFSPGLLSQDALRSGEIGYIATGIKEPEKVRVGDTIVNSKFQIINSKNLSLFSIHNSEFSIEALPGYSEPKSVVFASIFPELADEYEALRDALRKLKLNDASLMFEPESSAILGRGFRAGFLGVLHMEIISERLRREYGLSPIFSSPSVAYQIKIKGNGEKTVYSAAALPEEHLIEEIKEPWVKLEIISPHKFLGAINNIFKYRRVNYLSTEYLGIDRMLLSYEAPLKEIISGFYDQLKSATEGYASMSYELAGWRKENLKRLDILVAGEREEAFSQVLPKDSLEREGKRIVEKLKKLLPRQLFPVAIQASAEGRIIARETLPALKKDVTGYLYGGDRTRKMKLWKKQQKGKKRLKERGRVEIPPEVFLKMIKE